MERYIEGWSSLGLSSIVIKALLEKNFYSPTMIQTLTIPAAIFGHRDILGAAETGSGKTLAFGLPIINGILELKGKKVKCNKKLEKFNTNEIKNNMNDADNYKFQKKEKFNYLIKNNIGLTNLINDVEFESNNILKPLYAVILTPTRELACQIKHHLCEAAKFTNIKIAVLVGGLAIVKQERILNTGPEIVIATPGRLWELLYQGNHHLSQINLIKYLVIDETDRMMEKGHFLDLYKILEKIYCKESEVMQPQIFVFSATLTFVNDLPNYLQKKKNINTKQNVFKFNHIKKVQNVIDVFKMKNPKIIDITKATGIAKNLIECRIVCTIDHKDYYLYYFLKRHPGRTIIFCNSIGCVKRLTNLFQILHCNPLPLHAQMIQRQRLKNLERFESSNCGILIATDVAARGLDIPCIEHVIHYQVPRTSESYIHRSGRTARAQKKGITILMMEPSEKQFYSKLCKTLNRTEDLPIFPTIESLLIAIKERVNVAREIDKFQLQCRREKSEKGWLQKIASEMDILLDDQTFENTTDSKDLDNLKRLLKVKRNYLHNLIKKPLVYKSCKNFDISLVNDHSSHKAIDLMQNLMNIQN